MSQQWAIFNDEASDYTEEEAVEAGFYSLEDAEIALSERYDPDDGCFVRPAEEPEQELMSEQDTDEAREEVESLIEDNAIAGGRAVYEHGQWWVNQPHTGAIWSVVDTSEGLDLEVIERGDETEYEEEDE